MDRNRVKKKFITELRQGEQVNDIFLVARKNLAETKAGKPYLALGLMDKSGEIEARLWENAVQYDPAAAVGEVIMVNGTAKSFRDELQLGLTSLERVSAEEVRLEDFMPASQRSLSEMEAELLARVNGIANEQLKRLLLEIFQGQTLELFVHAPAAKKMHHAYIGGLVEHTLSIIGMAVKTAEHYPLIDRDLMVAGALLHDIAKIKEFDFTRMPIEYTDQGRLVGHLVLGVEMVREAARTIGDIDAALIDQIAHLILSHHGQLEFGSPVLPMTPEAMLLHHLDDMDAKMNYMEQLCEQMEEPGWQWTAYQRPLERFLYLRACGESAEPAPGEAHAMIKQPATRSKRVPLTNGQAKQKQQSLF